MRTNVVAYPVLLLAAMLIFGVPAAYGQIEGCPGDRCVESETSLVFNPQTNKMDAFTTATTDYTTSTWYDLCADLAIGRLNGPYLVNATNLRPSGNKMCITGAAQVEMSDSVTATPGRQYYAVGLAELHVYFEYYIFVPVPTCTIYCGPEYWFDVFGYSQIISTQPSESSWPSIVYTWPPVLVPVPVYGREIAMNGSSDTAWAPPVIYSVTPNQWPAGATTTFTISGEGFGYSPGLTISGTGILSFTNPCSAAPSSTCNTTIVATVTLDANTPAGAVETITVTANGQNPSGFYPVEIEGQSGQATAQATAQPFVAPIPQILFNGANVTNNGNPSCPGNVACVFVGQKIALTTSLPPGVTVQSYSWSMPEGVVVGGYTPSTASGRVQQFPTTQVGTCQTLAESCLNFYWVDPAPSRTVTFSYVLSNGQTRSATATFNVAGPTNVGIAVTPTPLNRNLIQVVQANQIVLGTSGLVMVFGSNVQGGQTGITLNASSTAPSGNQGQYKWIQLLSKYNIRFTDASSGWACSPVGSPAHDGVYRDDLYIGLEHKDSPWVPLQNDRGETAASFEATAYLMWTPNPAAGCTGPACNIQVPLANLRWGWTGDAINAFPQPNNSTWILTECKACSAGLAQVDRSYPRWEASTAGGTLNCYSIQ